VLDEAGVARVLRETRRIAVIGASARRSRPSNGVLRELLAAGYDCVPINPTEDEIEGLRVYPTLAEAVAATGPVDLVDVFRRPELCAPHAREAVEVGARVFWLQLGIVDWESAAIAAAGGLDVVMDRCTAIEVRRIRH
jgi:predicted CoA-binding protein